MFGRASISGAWITSSKTATTYPTTKHLLEGFGVTVEESPFIAHGKIATSGGCLAAQYVVGWVLEKKADKEWNDLVLKSIQPVGEGLKFSDAPELMKLYGPSAKVSVV